MHHSIFRNIHRHEQLPKELEDASMTDTTGARVRLHVFDPAAGGGKPQVHCIDGFVTNNDKAMIPREGYPVYSFDIAIPLTNQSQSVSLSSVNVVIPLVQGPNGRINVYEAQNAATIAAINNDVPVEFGTWAQAVIRSREAIEYDKEASKRNPKLTVKVDPATGWQPMVLEEPAAQHIERHWGVVVASLGEIGRVQARSLKAAREAAIMVFRKCGDRESHNFWEPHIFENDQFFVYAVGALIRVNNVLDLGEKYNFTLGLKQWHVEVANVGVIGRVSAIDERTAEIAACKMYGIANWRKYAKADATYHIYADDEFTVTEVKRDNARSAT